MTRCTCTVVHDPDGPEMGSWIRYCPTHRAAREMLTTLRATLKALEAHLDSDTLHSGLKHRDQLCPCNQIEVANARALLAKIEGGK